MVCHSALDAESSDFERHWIAGQARNDSENERVELEMTNKEGRAFVNCLKRDSSATLLELTRV